MLVFWRAFLVSAVFASSVLARPHARLRHPKKWAKKLAHLEVLAESEDSQTPVEFSTTAKAPKENIFISLTDDEAAAVISFLHKQPALNLTATANATAWDNAIEVIDLVQPNKTDALAFLDHNEPAPPRYALARIAFGATQHPYLQDFIVGPLPITNASTYASLDWQTTSGSSKIRNFNPDDDLVTEWNLKVTKTVADIVLDLLNGTVTGSDDDDFDIFGIDPLWQEEIDGKQRTILWNTYWRFPSGDAAIFDGETLLPQGLFFKSDITGRDSSKWKVLGWLYGGIFYETTAKFRKAWKSEGFVKYELNMPSAWIGTDRTGDALPADTLSPPVAVQPSGRRFAVDEAQKYVEWMDFSFYFTFTRDTGLRLFDIKYRGERIIYELGLQEAIAHYAGNDPVQSGTSYMDTFYGFGPYAFELAPGFDCPTYATYLNSTFHAAELSTTHRNNICLFESDPGYLMQRHTTSAYLAVTKNVVFTMRSVSTVGNYDYNFDYNFMLDGTIEIVVRASGYIQSAYYAKNDEYGYRIHDGLSGSMHDHALNWKVDMDILGTKNTFVKHKVVPVQVKYPWSNHTRSTMKVERVRVENENEGKLNWPANGGAMFIVENSDELNKYGEPRGYKIAPSRGGAGMYLTIQESSNLLKSQGFATHGLYVSKQKDTEVRASHANNDYDPGHPIIDFDKYFDGESINQTDIVLWVNLGMHHVPHTGDLPNTVFTSAQAAFLITPHNYFLHDTSRVTRQMLRIDYNSSGVQLVNQFGANQPDGMVNLTALQNNYHDYEGDVAVRKFPYDPLHPFNNTESIV
ncbi:Amine oxidase [Mycena indigotica]|uniref:Amine oxidase n=1 Tax=Mycena indigotica TaxID=2126181 RepID=A0A8H6TDY1_9AGAR|nr:Amine oxidase [Mycena indigotica]KAF7315690.1 Amine oxidase [Mycena indigotica]